MLLMALDMKISWYGNAFRITGTLWGEPWSPMVSLYKEPVVRTFDVSFDVSLNQLLNKQSMGWWTEMSWRPFDYNERLRLYPGRHTGNVTATAYQSQQFKCYYIQKHTDQTSIFSCLNRRWFRVWISNYIGMTIPWGNNDEYFEVDKYYEVTFKEACVMEVRYLFLTHCLVHYAGTPRVCTGWQTSLLDWL